MNDYDNMIGTPFREDNKTKKKDRPMPVKLNEKEEEMLKLSMYALNMHSKSGVLKLLAEWGFEKVLLDGLGVEKMHYLTRSDRTKIIHEKPTLRYYSRKGGTN